MKSWIIPTSLSICVLVLLLPTGAASSPVGSQNTAALIGVHFTNNVAVNGTMVAEFLLRSESSVSKVVLSYVGLGHTPLNTTLTSRSADINSADTWWAAMITPEVTGHVSGSTTQYHLLPMNIYVELPGGVIEIGVDDSSLPYWSVIQETTTQRVHTVGIPLGEAFLLFGGIVFTGGLGIVLEAKRIKRKSQGA